MSIWATVLMTMAMTPVADQGKDTGIAQEVTEVATDVIKAQDTANQAAHDSLLIPSPK